MRLVQTAAAWLATRNRTRLDLLVMLALGYVIGARAYATWWGIAVSFGAAMGLTDTATTWLRKRAPRTPHA
jgi:hypothetical protein